MPADLRELATAPTTRVQFSPDHLKPIFIGLDDLVAENNHVGATGSLRRHPDHADEYGRFNSHEAPTDEQMSAVMSAHSKIQPRLETGGWLRLDHRELTACYLAVSHGKRLVSRKLKPAWSPTYKADTNRLRSLIEKHRKRAIKLLPASSQKAERDKIVADLRVVRQRLAPNIPANKQPRSIRMAARQLVFNAVNLAIDGLRMRGFERPPNTTTLRQNVRACLHNLARRGLSRSAFLEDRISASLTLADYVIEHSNDLVRRRTLDECTPARAKPSQSGGAPASPYVGEAEPSMPAALRKEPPAHVRIACGDLEWLTMKDLDGQSAWSRMSRAARVDAVASAKKQGGKDLSNRHIARILGVDDHTVARMLDEAALPPDVREQIAYGKKSGSQALRQANDAVYQQSKRLLRERRDGSVSGEHAEQIVSYLSGFNAVFARQIVGRAKELVSRLDRLERLRRFVPRSDVKELMAMSLKRNVQADPDDPGIEAPAQRLCWWLLQVAPERDIHMLALDKATNALPKHTFPVSAGASGAV